MKRSYQERIADAINRKEMYLDLARQCDREIIDIELEEKNGRDSKKNN